LPKNNFGKETEVKDNSAQNGACSEEDKKKLLGLSEISISLETYDDIFSDFDPRDYSKRGLSEDFITEVKKASTDKPQNGIEVRLLIPENLRNLTHEKVIKERLRHYFGHHATILEKEIKENRNMGLKFIFLGILLMMLGTFLTFNYGKDSLLVDFLIVLVEPGGWFLFWEGSNVVIFESRKIKPDVEFYRKLSKCEIEFIPY
jgi:hypothetical protein